ncbi:TOMM precursor leader peptide-binding protein, partial [Frankia sp. AgKG'84/4]|nr:TOMM precursor leader peptide-binding protein [Frankia sp. AgKG'84/4]
MNAVVLVVGEGVLADRVCGELSGQYQVIRQTDFEAGIPETTGMALVLQDAWNPSVHQKSEEVLRSTGIPWLPGFVSFGEGVVGPLVRPGAPGCYQCADLRRIMAGRDRKEMWDIRQRMSVQEGIQRDVAASGTGLLQMAHLIGAEVPRVLQGEQAHSEGRVSLINMKTLNSSWHSFLPDPLCTVCGRLPDDSKASARISLQPSPKISSDSYRCRSMDDLGNVLVKDYLDHRAALLNNKMYDLVPPFGDA